jgi:hypothetical protein
MKQSAGAALFLMMFISVCPSQTQVSAPSISSSANIHNNSTHQPLLDSNKTAQVRFDLISPALFDSFLTVLARQSVIIEKNNIAAMGLLRDSAETDTSQSLFVIMLDQSGTPHKDSYTISKPLKKQHESSSSLAVPAGIKNQVKVRQDGRVYLMINTALKSLWVYPGGLSMAFQDRISPQVFWGVSFLTLGASLYGSYAYTRNMELGYGRVEMMNYGGDLGVAYPLLMASFLESSAGMRNGNANQLRGWGQMVGFPLGIFAGSFAKFSGNFEYGDASIMTSTSKFGFLYGFMIPMFFTDIGSQEYVSVSTGLTMALIPAGFYLGKLLVGDRHYSSGRSAFITTSAIMGTITGALIPTLWEDKNKEMYAATTLVGHLLGTLYGFEYMNDRSYTFGQGMFMAASAVVGTAVAEAIPLIAQTDFTKYHQAYTAAGFVGSWGGLMLGEILARALFEKSGRDNPKSVSVSFPGLLQAPLIWALSKNEVKGVATGNVQLVDVTF